MGTKWIYWLEKQCCQLRGWQAKLDCISHKKSNPLLLSLENRYLSWLKLKRRDKGSIQCCSEIKVKIHRMRSGFSFWFEIRGVITVNGMIERQSTLICLKSVTSYFLVSFLPASSSLLVFKGNPWDKNLSTADWTQGPEKQAMFRKSSYRLDDTFFGQIHKHMHTKPHLWLLVRLCLPAPKQPVVPLNHWTCLSCN